MKAFLPFRLGTVTIVSSSAKIAAKMSASCFILLTPQR